MDDNAQIGVLGGLYATTDRVSCPGIINVNINITNPDQFVEASSRWSEYGPFYEENDDIARYGATHTHAYGRTTGAMTYQFDLSVPPPQARLSARLSSEFPWYSAPADGYSDVSLIINGNRYPTRRVIPDNGSGRQEVWTVNPKHLRVGQNTVGFEASRNGLCIYKRPVNEFQFLQPQEYIRLEYP